MPAWPCGTFRPEAIHESGEVPLRLSWGRQGLVGQHRVSEGCLVAPEGHPVIWSFSFSAFSGWISLPTKSEALSGGSEDSPGLVRDDPLAISSCGYPPYKVLYLVLGRPCLNAALIVTHLEPFEIRRNAYSPKLVKILLNQALMSKT